MIRIGQLIGVKKWSIAGVVSATNQDYSPGLKYSDGSFEKVAKYYVERVHVT